MQTTDASIEVLQSQGVRVETPTRRFRLGLALEPYRPTLDLERLKDRVVEVILDARLEILALLHGAEWPNDRTFMPKPFVRHVGIGAKAVNGAREPSHHVGNL